MHEAVEVPVSYTMLRERTGFQESGLRKIRLCTVCNAAFKEGRELARTHYATFVKARVAETRNSESEDILLLLTGNGGIADFAGCENTA